MKKSFYILSWISFLLFSFAYVHVFAQMPVHVYINDQKIESEDIVSFDTSVRVNIRLEDIEVDDVHIVLLQNEVAYKTIYQKTQEEIHFALHDDGMYQLKIYIHRENKRDVYTFSFHIEQKEKALSFLMNEEPLTSTIYAPSSVLKVISHNEELDYIHSKVYINDESYPVKWTQKEDMFIFDMVLEQEGIYKIDILMGYKGFDEHVQRVYIIIGDPFAFQYTFNGEDRLQDKVYDHQNILFEGKIQWMYDEEMFDIYINHKRVCVDWIKENDGYKYFQYMFKEEGIYHIEVIGKKETFYFSLLSKQIIIDKKSPHIQYRYEKEDPKEYTFTRKVHLTIDESNIDQNSFIIMANKNGEPFVCHPLWSFHEDHWEVQILFDEEGMYDIFMTMKDLAGNIGVWQYQEEEKPYFQSQFIVDQTPPKVELTGICSGAIFHDSQELTLVADDEYFAFYEIVVTRNGEDYALNIPKQGDRCIAYQHRFDELSVGYYEVFIKAYDLAGNSTSSDKLTFTIDAEVPKVFIWLDNKPYYEGVRYIRKEALEVKVEVKDTSIRSQRIRILKNGEVILEEEDNEISNAKQCIYQLYNELYESDYQLQIEVVDWAGNKIKKTAYFKMNTQADTILIVNDIFKGTPKKGPWTPMIQYNQEKFYITDCILMKDHMLMDYVWGEAIVEDGEYILEVFARDYAGNDIAFLEAFTFTIDNTPPHIVIQDQYHNDINKYAQFYHQGPLCIQTQDQNDVISSIVMNEVALDIEQYKIQAEETSYYELPITENGHHRIEIYAVDHAGNTNYEAVHVILDTLAYTKQKIMMMIIMFGLCSFSISGYVLWKKTCKLRF